MSHILTTHSPLHHTPERFGLVAALEAPLNRADRRELQHWFAAHLARAQRHGRPAPRCILFGSRGERQASREVLVELALDTRIDRDAQIAIATDALEEALSAYGIAESCVAVTYA